MAAKCAADGASSSHCFCIIFSGVCCKQGRCLGCFRISQPFRKACSGGWSSRLSSRVRNSGIGIPEYIFPSRAPPDLVNYCSNNAGDFPPSQNNNIARLYTLITSSKHLQTAAADLIATSMLRSRSFGLASVTLCLADERKEGQVNHPINWLAWQHPSVPLHDPWPSIISKCPCPLD